MSEHEKTAAQHAEEMMQALDRVMESTRDAHRRTHYGNVLASFRAYVEANGAEHRAAALEEAAHWFDDSEPGTEWDAKSASSEMRALASQPASVVPVARVREVLARQRNAARVASTDVDPVAFLDAAARDLGVDLDAATETACVGCIPGNGNVPDGHVAFASPDCPVHGT